MIAVMSVGLKDFYDHWQIAENILSGEPFFLVLQQVLILRITQFIITWSLYG